VSCTANYAPYCGDGSRNATELCDPNDPNKIGWGTGTPGCSAACTPIDTAANPYSACVPGNPNTDCATNTYATQAACLLANPGASGRTCYLNNIVSCNATRAAQCPVLAACIPGPTTGAQAAPLTAASPGLCLGGPTVVGGFTGTTVGTTTTYNWSCNGSAVGGACAATYNSGSSIPGFDLALKKYIGTNDAQTAPGVSTTNAATHTYIIRVTNSGASSTASSGTTTVQDILPAGVEYTASGSGTGWTCSVALRTLTCTSTQGVAP
jgi:uncharacterized repeat protein (TIGR01451 family)